jgi:3'-5' exoribonuclease
MEATILNYLDDLDSKINGIRTHIRKEPDNPSRWTSYHRLYDRYFFKENCQKDELAEVQQKVEPEVEQPAPEAARSTGSPEREVARKTFSNSPFAVLKN